MAVLCHACNALRMQFDQIVPAVLRLFPKGLRARDVCKRSTLGAYISYSLRDTGETNIPTYMFHVDLAE